MASPLGMMNIDQLCTWMEDQDFSMDVIESFRGSLARGKIILTSWRHVFVDNEMDGEALETLIGTSIGPDCLKELIPKLGVRLKVYQRIKTMMFSPVRYSTGIAM